MYYGKDKILYRTIKADRLSSIILFGPPGCGKTSLARVISETTKYKFYKINAVTAGVADIKKVIEETEKDCHAEIEPIQKEINELNDAIAKLQEASKGKKDEEIPVTEKEELRNKEKEVDSLRKKESELLTQYANKHKLVRQLVDLALLSNNMLKGEALSQFIKRSVEML